MALFPQTFIDDLRLRANILQVVQEEVPLKKAGTAHKGLCPFHSEKTPSFQVVPDKGFFHCFGCNTNGDVFKFLELHEKISFPDAVKQIAQKFGVALPEMADGGSEDAKRDSQLREALLKAHEIAADYFKEQLASPAGAHAREQLKDRGLAPQTIETLGFGYAPASRDGLKQRLLKQGFAHGVLLQSGLIVARESGDSVDRFRNRLMVPICRDTGSIIAFGGRQMDKDQGGPKYLNSPETPIYSKGHTLYGLNQTKTQIRKADFAVLVEGYFDFAQVFQAQAAPAVASCGTALTAAQADLLRRFTAKVVLSFDPDAAGRRRRGPLERPPRHQRLRRQRRHARQGRRSRYIHQEVRGRSVQSQTPKVEAVPGTPAGSGGRRARSRARKRPASVSGQNAHRRGRNPGSRGPGPVCGPHRTQSPDYGRRGPGGNP